MLFKGLSIRQKLRWVIMVTAIAVLSLTCSALFIYEYVSFRKTSLEELSGLGRILASNSTAALAFEDDEAADEILSALKNERHIVAACLYNEDGVIFSSYPVHYPDNYFPRVEETVYRFQQTYLEGFEIVKEGDRKLGTLYIRSDMDVIYDRFRLYGVVVLGVIIVSIVLAYFISDYLQRSVSKPVMSLAETAKAVSDRQDYGIRVTKLDDDELGVLTDTFNHMLDRIQAQTAEILSFSQKLEQQVAERTRELQSVNSELESFSYSISHDLRAPLRSIHGYVNILAEEYGSALDEEGNRLVGIILKNGQRMGQLIDDLLAFSRLGRKDLNMSVVSMNDLVTLIVDDQRRQNEDRTIDVELLPLPVIKADHSTIQQVWINLISNAIKYSRRQKKTVIEIGSIDEPEEITFYVKDNGAGFDMKYYDKLFGVFQRLHATSEFDGTGVGLAIVHRIIVRHGGRIWATSKVNEGATFFFSLKKD